MTVSDQVTDILLKLDGVADIEFVPTKDLFGIQDSTYSTAGQMPITVERSGSRMILTQNFIRRPWTQWDHADAASYKLLLPEGRKVVVDAGNATFSGNIRASRLSITAANLSAQALGIEVEDALEIKGAIAHFDMQVKRCRRIQLRLGIVTGRLIAPAGAEITNTSGVSTLKVRLSAD